MQFASISRMFDISYLQPLVLITDYCLLITHYGHYLLGLRQHKIENGCV